jgi:cytochrome c-type biogenesis protein CcmH
MQRLVKGGGVRAAAEGVQPAVRAAVPLLLTWMALAGVVGGVSGATLDDQVYAIAGQLMCPVCAGQTVAESDSALAREMRAIIRQKLQAGETRDQILRYFVAQFGESVLAEPRPGGVALILYGGTPAALILGVAAAILFIRRRGARPSSREAPEEPARAPHRM